LWSTGLLQLLFIYIFLYFFVPGGAPLAAFPEWRRGGVKAGRGVKKEYNKILLNDFVDLAPRFWKKNVRCF
jgi:hypothetical protein